MPLLGLQGVSQQCKWVFFVSFFLGLSTATKSPMDDVATAAGTILQQQQTKLSTKRAEEVLKKTKWTWASLRVIAVERVLNDLPTLVVAVVSSRYVVKVGSGWRAVFGRNWTE